MSGTPIERAERLHLERWTQHGFERLLPFEQNHVAILSFMTDVMNGGAHQFLFNSSGDLAAYVRAGLKAVEARKTLALLDEALALIPGGYCEDREKRWMRLGKLKVEVFDSVSARLIESPEDIVQLSLRLVATEYRANGFLK